MYVPRSSEQHVTLEASRPCSSPVCLASSCRGHSARPRELQVRLLVRLWTPNSHMAMPGCSRSLQLFDTSAMLRLHVGSGFVQLALLPCSGEVVIFGLRTPLTAACIFEPSCLQLARSPEHFPDLSGTHCAAATRLGVCTPPRHARLLAALEQFVDKLGCVMEAQSSLPQTQRRRSQTMELVARTLRLRMPEHCAPLLETHWGVCDASCWHRGCPPHMLASRQPQGLLGVCCSVRCRCAVPLPYLALLPLAHMRRRVLLDERACLSAHAFLPPPRFLYMANFPTARNDGSDSDTVVSPTSLL